MQLVYSTASADWECVFFSPSQQDMGYEYCWYPIYFRIFASISLNIESFGVIQLKDLYV